MLMLLISLAALVRTGGARPSLSSQENDFTIANEPEEVRSAAIKKLLEVFGMEDPPAIHGHKQPPQYMLDLYNTVADVDGVTKDPYLLEGNTVRSFFDKRKLGFVRKRTGQCEYRRPFMVFNYVNFTLQCGVNRWSTDSICPQLQGQKRSSLQSSISSSCGLRQHWHSTDTISARFVLLQVDRATTTPVLSVIVTPSPCFNFRSVFIRLWTTTEATTTHKIRSCSPLD